MDAKSFSISIQGASHIKKNKECQDYSASYFDDKCSIAIVCDGHGGDDYMRSAYGSKFAAEVSLDNIKAFVSGVDTEKLSRNPDKTLNILKASIINGWNNAVHNHFESNPFTDVELSGISEKARKRYIQQGKIESAYGTTLIAVARTDNYWFGLHIGDGKCVAINNESSFAQPIPWDEKCFLNATTSICDSDALERFRHYYSNELPAAVFVGSDGIDDCFNNEEQFNNFYKTILYSFGTSEFDSAVQDLRDFLPRLSQKGSGDDVSIAAFMSIEEVANLEIVKNFDRDKEKARVEENARKEAERNEEEKRRVEQEHEAFLRKNESKSGKKCPRCGGKLLRGMQFCPTCGLKLSNLQEAQRSGLLSSGENASEITELEITVAENERIRSDDERSVIEDVVEENLGAQEQDECDTARNDELETEEADQIKEVGETSDDVESEIESSEQILEDSETTADHELIMKPSEQIQEDSGASDDEELEMKPSERVQRDSCITDLEEPNEDCQSDCIEK